MKKVTQEYIKELLKYDPGTGIFTWIVGRGSAGTGSVAGELNKMGYIRISIDGKRYQAHRLAWLYVYGYFPENWLDHVNRNPSDNRIKNIREASNQCNQRNRGNPKNNTSGVKGVWWLGRTNRWVAQIKVNNERIHLGHYKSFINAVCIRLAAEQCFNWSGCDSSSPAYKYVQKHIVNKT